jgi:phosphoglycerol transferase MdoB-like AlkP superfamily enzyme
MNNSLINLFFLISRYVHIVATTIIVGGTLFFEMVVPLAIGDLKNEVQLALFGRMRWLFRWVVYTCAVALIITGAVSIYRNYSVLDGSFVSLLNQGVGSQRIQAMQDESVLNRPKPWFIAHIAAGVASIAIALMLVVGGRPPEKPLRTMRLNLLVLMIAIFLASASRGARQNLFQPLLHGQSMPTMHE